MKKSLLMLAAAVAMAAFSFTATASPTAPPPGHSVATSHAGVAAVDVGSISAADHKETMSYSFSVKGATKAAALAAAVAKFDTEVIAQQKVHAVDREAALKNAETHLALLAEPNAGEEFALSMHGSVGGDLDWATGEARRLTTAGSGCTAWLTTPPPSA